MRVQNPRFRFQNSVFMVQDFNETGTHGKLTHRFWGLGFRDESVGFRVRGRTPFLEFIHNLAQRSALTGTLNPWALYSAPT